ncbi:MAG: sodium:solute symporter family protein [Chlamydiales bacterium]|nr:sodium:solute symporter family protein [Chlamydiales bacterium]
MNLTLLFSLLTFLGISQLWIGKKSQSQDHDDYFLMGRRLGLFSLVMTLLATQIGGGMLLGAAEEAYRYGFGALFYPLGMVVGMVILGCGFGAKFRKLELSTIAEVFEKVYGSTRLRKIASLLSIVSLFFILAAQAIAARKFFISIGFETHLLFVATWAILVIYTAFGGLKAVVRTDILQASFIIASFGIASFGRRPEFTPFVGESVPWATWLFVPLAFMLIEQDMGQRCFAAKSPKTVTFASFIAAGALLLISLFPITVGVAARSAGLEIPQGGSVLIFAIAAFTNPTILTILVAAILMAIVSTSDSLLSAISSNLACDFLSKGSLLSCRLLTLAIGMGTLVFSFFFDNVVRMLMFAYELSVYVLLIPVLMALLFKRPSKKIAIAAMVVGGLWKLWLR